MSTLSKYTRPSLDLRAVADIDEIVDHREKVYEAAMLYIASGFKVMPIQRNIKDLPKQGINHQSCSGNKATIEKWFNPHSGKYSGWNIALGVGYEGGPFVVDLDMHGDKDGVKVWEDLIPDGWCHDGMVTKTPRGGYHLYFMWEENMVTTDCKIGHGIDTRGGRGTTITSNIMVWPSIYKGISYQWAGGSDLPDVPSFLRSVMGIAWNKKGATKGGGRGNEEMDEAAMEDKFNTQQLEEMLTYINPDEMSYQEWLGIGQALNSQHPNDKGLILWDDWSKRGKRYEERECERRWSGFTPDGGTRIGTIIHHAREGGWNTYYPASQAIDEAQNDELIDRMNEQYAIVVIETDIRVVINKPDREGKPFSLLKKGSFFDLMAPHKELVETPQGNKMVPVTELWWNNVRRKEYSGGIVFEPAKPAEFDGCINLFRGFKIKPEQGGSWQLFSDHILNNICHGNEEHHRWVIDWIADIFQDPANIKGTSLVLRGGEGTGKGTIFKVLDHLLGYYFMQVTDADHLVGKFNVMQEGKLLMFADEAFFGADKKISGKLKGMVTEKNRVVERKGIDAYKSKNCMRVGISSNEKWVVPAGSDSRRWAVFLVSTAHKEDIEYFRAIDNQLKDGGYEAMMYDLLNREITSNLRSAPVTDELKQQRALLAASNPFNKWLHQCIITQFGNVGRVMGDDGEWPEYLLPSDLYDSYSRYCSDNNCKYPDMTSPFYKEFIRALSLAPDDGTRATCQKTIGAKKKRIRVYPIPAYKFTLDAVSVNCGIEIEEEDES